MHVASPAQKYGSVRAALLRSFGVGDNLSRWAPTPVSYTAAPARSPRLPTTVMITSRLPRVLTSLAVGALATATIGTAAAAQGQPNMGLGPTLPKSGTIPRDTAYERKVLAQMKAPEGFT